VPLRLSRPPLTFVDVALGDETEAQRALDPLVVVNDDMS
jgi:hypothetical protein